MNTTIETMTKQLTDALAPTVLEIIDDSADHIGHYASGGHYTVKIASGKFADLSRLESHQLVYEALGDLMKEEIHALRIEIIKE